MTTWSKISNWFNSLNKALRVISITIGGLGAVYGAGKGVMAVAEARVEKKAVQAEILMRLESIEENQLEEYKAKLKFEKAILDSITNLHREIDANRLAIEVNREVARIDRSHRRDWSHEQLEETIQIILDNMGLSQKKTLIMNDPTAYGRNGSEGTIGRETMQSNSNP